MQYRIVAMDSIVKGSIIEIEAESYEQALLRVGRMEGKLIEETDYLYAQRDAGHHVEQEDVDDVDIWQIAREYSDKLASYIS